jgi:hypothetical protein
MGVVDNRRRRIDIAHNRDRHIRAGIARIRQRQAGAVIGG